MTLGTEPAAPGRELKFGTSGRRGRLADLTQLEIYINVAGELAYLQSLPATEGGIVCGDEFYLGCDLRPSSPSLLAAVEEAVRDAGMRPVALGEIPTPALACYAWSRGKGSIMVTGSHIPFDWNGYKLNTSRGELMKEHEEPINASVRRERSRLSDEPASSSKFDGSGALKAPRASAPADPDARDEYLRRYLGFFAPGQLAGMRIAVYQHSAVGRDLLVDVLRELGAEVTPVGRSETFVPIDTENIDEETVSRIAGLLPPGPLDAVVSTDGDSDRPLILAPGAGGRLRFFPGDVVGMIVAEQLGAAAVVVPVSCNDAIDRGPLAAALEPKTRIGSPYVIAGMKRAAEQGRTPVCGWEANGGFLLGSGVQRNERFLGALPTRDAFLPILAVLCGAREKRVPLADLFDALPPRYTAATLVKEFPREAGARLVAELEPASLEPLFGAVEHVDRTDGQRIRFVSGDVVHFRPSGNADEFRIYACADSPDRAAEVVRLGAEFVRGSYR